MWRSATTESSGPGENESREMIPTDLFVRPSETVPRPPVDTRAQELPFADLTWQNFERLCYRIASLETDVEECRRYGREGQAQQGIDLYARRSDGRYDVWQCKRYSVVSPADVSRSVDTFLDGTWAKRAASVTLSVSASVQGTALQESIETQASRLSARGISFHVLDQVKLSERLKELPALVDDFFGRTWVVALCGEESASALIDQRRVLTGEEVAKLRTELSTFYSAYFSTLDRGIGHLSSSSFIFAGLPDLRSRYVVPEVIVRSAVSGVDRPTDKTGGGDGGEQNDQRRSPYPRRARDTDSAAVEGAFRRPLGDWLSAGRRFALVGEAGFGKSALLRFLALDLLSEKPRLGRAAQVWGDYLPVLIPFSRWARMVSRISGGIALERVVQSFFEEFSASGELIDLIERCFSDRRLILLVDGVDEWHEETNARAVFDQIETVSKTRDVATVITGRPYGFEKLGPLGHVWSTAELAPLDESQQRRLAMNWFVESLNRESDRESDERSASLVVDIFFRDLKSSGQLSALGSSPLLLTGLIALRMRKVALPRDRIQVYEELIRLLLEIHPDERASAARDQRPRFEVLFDSQLRQQTLACLAHEMMERGAEAGMPRAEAEAILMRFLRDDSAAALSEDAARSGAREILAVNAETSGILVEKAPSEIGFFHSVFGEYLTGCHVASWDLQDQISFATTRCADYRFKTAIIALLSRLTRPSEVDVLVSSIRSAEIGPQGGVVRTQLLAEIAFGSSRRSADLAKNIATEVFDYIETSYWQPQKQALLSVVLQNTSNSLREAVSSKVVQWYPESQWSRELPILATRSWRPDSELFAMLLRNIYDGSLWNQRAASTALATVFSHDDDVEQRLMTAVKSPAPPAASAMLLWTLVNGWSENPELIELVGAARMSRSPVISLYGIASSIALNIHTHDDLERLIGLCRGHSFDLYEVRGDLVGALVAGWPGDATGL